MDEKEILTTREVAEYLRVHVITVYRWVKTGQIPFFKVGGRLRFRRCDIA